MSSRSALSRTALKLFQKKNATLRASSFRLVAPISQHPWVGTTTLEAPRWFSSETKPDEPTEATTEPPKEEAETATEEAAPEETAEDQIAKLEAQVKDLRDQLLRSLAEQDNTRRIAQRDIESARNFAVQSFAKSLLEVSDNLTLALQSVPEEERTSGDNPTLKTLFEGIEMTEKGLMKAFEKNGLVKYGEPGETFDPNKHEALYEYPDPEKEAGSIGQVMKAGFMLRDRVLRPAEVGVIKGE